jgi:hypothetical protein
MNLVHGVATGFEGDVGNLSEGATVTGDAFVELTSGFEFACGAIDY